MEEQVTKVRPSPEATDESDEENGAEQGEIENPWQRGVYQRPVEDTEPVQEGEGSQPQLRRSTRIRKPNPKYANAAVAEVEIPKEPETFDEASQSPKWFKAMEEEIASLDQNQLGNSCQNRKK